MCYYQNKSALRLNESCVRLSLFVRKKHRVRAQLDIWATVLPLFVLPDCPTLLNGELSKA